MADITYCVNDKCKNKYKCERYRDVMGKENYWLAIFKPETCPERDFSNIWENKYYEQVQEAEKELQGKLQDYKDCLKDDLAGLYTKIYKLLDGKISDYDMERVQNWIYEVGDNNEKRRF